MRYGQASLCKKTCQQERRVPNVGMIRTVDLLQQKVTACKYLNVSKIDAEELLATNLAWQRYIYPLFEPSAIIVWKVIVSY